MITNPPGLVTTRARNAVKTTIAKTVGHGVRSVPAVHQHVEDAEQGRTRKTRRATNIEQLQVAEVQIEAAVHKDVEMSPQKNRGR